MFLQCLMPLISISESVLKEQMLTNAIVMYNIFAYKGLLHLYCILLGIKKLRVHWDIFCL